MLPSSNTIARIVFAIATLALLLLSFTLYRQVSSLLKVQEDISETHLVRLKLEQTMSTLQDAEIAQRGFLLTRDSLFLHPYNGAYEKARILLSELRRRTNHDPVQQRALNSLNTFIEVRFKTFATVIEQYSDPEINATTRKQHLLKGKSSMDSIRLYAAQVESRALLSAHESEESRKWRQLVTPLYAFLFMLACIGILLYSYGQVAKALNRTSNLLVQLKRMNRSLKEKNMALERSNKELDSFTYVASHDLKEPLRKILTFCGLADTATPEELPRHLERIRVSAMRMKQLLNDLLHYSMTVQNNQPMETVDLHQLVTDVQEHLKEELKETGAAIETQGLPVVQGIPFQLRQLFENLIGNALKYHQKEDAPQILISCCTVPAAAVPCAGIKRSRFYHQLRIRDNGAGFSNEYAEKIFEPFQRLPTVQKKEGTGIGLTICKKIIQNHDGFIRAESIPDMGSVFEIYLPV